ncbi:MAG: hypothetical protein AAF170_02575 [Bacteroidota bacterium]
MLSVPADAQYSSIHSDASITIGLPEGWSVAGPRNAKVGIHLSNTTLSSPPHLVIEEVATTTSISDALGARLLASFVPATFRAVDHVQANTLVVYEANGYPVRAAVYVKRHLTDGYAMLGMLLADEADFEAMDGVALLRQVVESAYPTERPHFRARQAAASDPSSSRRRVTSAVNTVDGRGVQETSVYDSSVRSASGSEGQPVRLGRLVGTWRTYEGGGTVRRDTPGQTAAQAGGVTYTFMRNGTFRARYQATAITGTFRSRTDVTETGRFTLEGLTLTLRPTQHSGWISVGAANTREAVRDTNPPARTYRLFEYGGEFVLRGICAPYQVDAICGRRSARRTLDFGMEPAR